MEIVWREPPERGKGGVKSSLLSEKWKELTDALKAHPGQWAEAERVEIKENEKNKNNKLSASMAFFKSNGYEAVSRTEYEDEKQYVTLFVRFNEEVDAEDEGE